MIKYQVRSRELIDVVNELNAKRLIKSPYFQRNLVWRDIHKVDFIKTILLGLPFPQIFIAKGEIDVETMTTYSCVVDGQQRLTAIQEYIAGNIQVDGYSFDKLDPSEKVDFLKYQIPIIDLDIRQDDPTLKEIFKRLNRTFYALSAIEKQSAEYAASDMMIIAKALSDQFFSYEEDANGELKPREIDPIVSKETIARVKTLNFTEFQSLILANSVFSTHEIARQVPVSFALNLLATCTSGWYNRNTRVTDLLDAEEYNLDHYISLAERLNVVAAHLNKLGLKAGAYWFNKANLYSLIIAAYARFDDFTKLKPSQIKKRLNAFAEAVPADYAIAAKEAVNNKRERMIRNDHLLTILYSNVAV